MVSNDKYSRIPGKKEASIVRSSAAEYLTFVAASGHSESSLEMRYENENIWLTQKMMATLYDVSVSAINQHLKRIFADNELDPAGETTAVFRDSAFADDVAKTNLAAILQQHGLEIIRSL
jgi:hypothetical protein